MGQDSASSSAAASTGISSQGNLSVGPQQPNVLLYVVIALGILGVLFVFRRGK